MSPQVRTEEEAAMENVIEGLTERAEKLERQCAGVAAERDSLRGSFNEMEQNCRWYEAAMPRIISQRNLAISKLHDEGVEWCRGGARVSRLEHGEDSPAAKAYDRAADHLEDELAALKLWVEADETELKEAAP